MIEHTGRPWLNYLLGLLCIGAIVAAILVVGPASGSQTSATRTAKAVKGVVQSTVSGSGNLQPASQLNLGFKTSGTVTQINVTQGQQVTEGQLLATLDPQSAEVTLEQSKAALLSAEATLAREEETDGEGSSGSSGTRATAADVSSVEAAPDTGTKAKGESQGKSEDKGKSEGTGERESTQTSSTSSSPSSTSTPTLSAATREANIASARATVKSDQLTVHSDEQAVQDTKLYAPEDGTIVTLSGQIGEVVSASGTTRDSAASSSSTGSSTGASSSSSREGAGATGSSGSDASSSATGSSTSAFAVLSDLSSMQLVVALSESEIGHVKVGQIATVTIEALEGRKLAAHVHEVATLSTSSSGVVSYDVTFQLDQMETGLKPGMSATAEVVVKQAEGVNVPSSAVAGGSVTVVQGGKHVSRRVSTGLVGNSSTIVLSGLKAGETVVLPQASSSSSSATSLLSRLAGRSGGLGGARTGLGGGGAGGGFAGGGGAAFFKGGG